MGGVSLKLFLPTPLLFLQIITMKVLLSLSLLLVLLEVSQAGPFFKAGFIKGALKGLLTGAGASQKKKDDRQCQVKWEEVWQPHCTTSYETLCRNEPRQECAHEYREECWTEQRKQCTTEYERSCATSYQQQCETQHEEECVHEQDCSDLNASRQKRSASEEEELIEDEEFDVELRSALEDLSDSDYAELANEFSEEDLSALAEDHDENHDAEARFDDTGVAVRDADFNSRSKREIFLKKKLLLKHALKKALPAIKKAIPAALGLGLVTAPVKAAGAAVGAATIGAKKGTIVGATIGAKKGVAVGAAAGFAKGSAKGEEVQDHPHREVRQLPRRELPRRAPGEVL